MDIRTGKTYATVEEARADGVPESDIAHLLFKENVLKDVQFAKPQFDFTKGSFKKSVTK